MDKKGQVNIFIVLMLGIVCFVLGMALAPALKPAIQEGMDSEMLNCSSSDISQMKEAVCMQMDMVLPLFIGLIFGLAGILIGGIAIR